MVVLNSLRLLNELSQIETKIKTLEEFLEQEELHLNQEEIIQVVLNYE